MPSGEGAGHGTQPLVPNRALWSGAWPDPAARCALRSWGGGFPQAEAGVTREKGHHEAPGLRQARPCRSQCVLRGAVPRLGWVTLGCGKLKDRPFGVALRVQSKELQGGAAPNAINPLTLPNMAASKERRLACVACADSVSPRDAFPWEARLHNSTFSQPKIKSATPLSPSRENFGKDFQLFECLLPLKLV